MAAYVLAGLVAGQSWRHTIIFDDSLNLLWREYTHDAHIDHRHNRSVKGGGGGSLPNTCSRSMRVSLKPRGHVRLHADAPIRDFQRMSLQFWVRALAGTPAVAKCAPAPQRTPRGFSCAAPLCISLRRSWAGESAALVLPLCTFGEVDARRWAKLVVPASAFSPSFGEAFDEVVLLAGDSGAQEEQQLLIDDLVLVSATKPPATPRNLPRGPVGQAKAEPGHSLPTCRIEDGDHLIGGWVQNCAPEAIKRPDRYAYGRSLGRTIGQWDYRLCYKLSYGERERSRNALSWTWRPEGCSLSPVDGGRFSKWLGARTLLFWGDSLTAQQFYSLVFLLGDAVVSIRDVQPAAAKSGRRAARRRAGLDGSLDGGGHPCDYTGVGDEGGAYTEALLSGGGRILKVLGHAEMVGELRRFDSGWWGAIWGEADLIVFNPAGHHMRNVDGSFGSYGSIVSDALSQIEARSKRSARFILRTSNVGHAKCEAEAQPLPSTADAWRSLGGWGWTPPGFTPAYFGAKRSGADPYDWRAPPLHEHIWRQRASAVAALAGRFATLNVSHLDARSDGHVGAAMALHADKKKAGASHDCLHYCLPGPSDGWALALYNLLLNNAKYAGPA